MDILTERGHLINALPPASVAMNTPSDIINVANYHDITFLIQKGAGAVGTAVISVDVCDTTAPGNTAKCGFKYRRQVGGTDTWGAVTDRTAAETFTTIASADDMYEISVNIDEIGSTVVNGVRGNHYVRLSVAQVDATAVIYGITAILGRARYGQNVPVSAIV